MILSYSSTSKAARAIILVERVSGGHGFSFVASSVILKHQSHTQKKSIANMKNKIKCLIVPKTNKMIAQQS